MPKRIPHTDLEVLTGTETAEDYLAMQRRLGRFYLNRFRKILGGLGKSGRFLEIGSGPGYQTAIIAEDYPEAEIVALEPSPDMVRIATAYVADKGLSERVRFVEGTVEDDALVAGLGTFDLVYSTFSLHHWTDPQRALRNLYGALASGGVMLIFDFERRWLTYYLMPGPRGMRESIKAAFTRQEIEAMLAELGITTFAIDRSFPYMAAVARKE
jgi:ubiquinone/menaquinone biosynthesis C-methylase UbiE